MKSSYSRGFIGLFIVMIVGLAILVSIGYNVYQNQPGGFWGQIEGQVERPGNILIHVISIFRNSASSSPSIESSSTVAAGVGI